MKEKIDSIQILRAFAAVAVVVFHTGYAVGTWRPVGTFGVDIFFVISGFIMAMICATNTQHFFVRRLIRILPLYWTLTLIVFTMVFSSLAHRGVSDLVRSLLFISYVRADGNIYPIVLTGWTLNYEMFFYVILAVSIFIARKRAALIAGLLLLAVMLAMKLLPHSVVSDFYSNGIMLEFVGGIFTYEIYRRMPSLLCRRLRPLLTGVIAASIAFMVWHEGTRLQDALDLRWIYAGVPAVFLLQSVVLLSKSGVDANWRFGVLLGDASYSLYLTHFYVVTLFRSFWRTEGFTGMMAAVGLSCVVGIGVHQLMDRPAYTYLNRVFVSRRQKPVPVVETIP